MDLPIPYASYSNGDVYIASEEVINSIITDGSDVYIVDKRNGKDPNMCINSSYRITSQNQRDEILEIFQETREYSHDLLKRQDESKQSKRKKGF